MNLFMKIIIISDWHLGVDWGTELEMDSFAHLLQAFSQIKEENPDLILVSGDIFNETVPSQEIFFEVINFFSSLDLDNKIGITNNGKKLKYPIVCIEGNHEYRGKDFKSAVQLLEAMGFLKRLNLESISVFNEDEKINIFGIGSFPDKYFLDILNKWSPIPERGAYNILLMHQSFREFLPFESNDEIPSLSNLPKGFNVIVNGHLHWSYKTMLNDNEYFIMPGSTTTTQNKKIEADNPKGFFVLNTKTNEFLFKEINGTRPIFYLDLHFENSSINQVLGKIKSELDIIKQKKLFKKPLIRIRLKGDLEKGYFLKDLNLKDIEKDYPDFYISFSVKLNEKGLKESINTIQELQKQKRSLEDISRDVFFEQISQTNVSKDFDYKRLFEILYNDDLEKAKDFIFL